MFEALANAFRIPDLRKKILFTIAIIAMYRVGAHIPVPGVSRAMIDALTAAAQSPTDQMTTASTLPLPPLPPRATTRPPSPSPRPPPSSKLVTTRWAKATAVAYSSGAPSLQISVVSHLR